MAERRRICSICGPPSQPIKNFRLYKKYRLRFCRKCETAKQKKRYFERKRERMQGAARQRIRTQEELVKLVNKQIKTLQTWGRRL